MSQQIGGSARRYRQRVGAARLVVTVERAWPALWPTVAVLGLFIAISLLGVWQILPLPLHLLGLIAVCSALAATLWRARGQLRLAARAQGLARLERDSGIAHQPLRALEDDLPPGVDDPATRRLWQLHRARLERAVQRLRLLPPRSLLPQHDPWALRALLLLVLVVAVVHARGELNPRLLAAFDLGRPAQAAIPPRVDLWVTPPVYTRQAPMGVEQTRGQAVLTVPEGSTALAQVHHLPRRDGVGPTLGFNGAGVPLRPLGDGSQEARVDLTIPGRLAILDGEGLELAGWGVEVVADGAPTVTFTAPPSGTHRGTMRVQAEAQDDYGLAELGLLMAPAGRRDEVERLGLVKPANHPPTFKSAAFLDLTAHPLAGLPVKLRLVAVDVVGQEGRSEEIEITLPAREFRHPLARAIIEQRRDLVRDPATAPDVAGRLAVLADTEIAQRLPTTVPLSLRVAAARLGGKDAEADRASVVALLWDLALFIEDGALSVAEKKLREKQEELQRALSEGARDEELERLMREMQQALDEFLDEMTRQSQQQAERNEPQQQMPRNGQQQMVERQDLQEMLDRARELMRGGARDAAREQLAQLQEMLENLRAQTAQQPQPSEGEQALSDLQKMIELQQQLLQKSFDMQRQQQRGGERQGQQQQGQQQQGQQQGQQQQGQQGQDPMGSAAAEQEGLRRALGELMRRLGEQGMEIPRAMGQAELQMRGAKGSLDQGEPGGAAESQTQAVDAMQRAGQAMMEQMQQQMGQQPGEGPPGQQPAAQRRGRDPLGRAQRNDGGYDTQGTEVPTESDVGRARDLLQELYRRSGERRRSPSELQYYDRLLDRF